MIKGIIFDCFGVLVGRGFAETYRLAGGDPVADADFIEDLLGQTNLGRISSRQFSEQMAEKLGISVGDFLSAVEKAEQPNEELLDYIAALHQTYKTAILSNANVGTLQRKLGAEVLAKNFDELIVSAEVGLVKPDSAIYLLAAQKLNLKPAECVFIDDHSGYCVAAAATGMQTVHYREFKKFRDDLEKVLAK